MRRFLIAIGRIVERLLAPTPKDNGYKGLKDPVEFLYPESLEPGKPKEPRYLNLGAGDFRHRMWHNLDHEPKIKKIAQRCYEHTDINHDRNSLKSIPIKSDSIKIAYSSHSIEHLSDEAGRFLMEEVYRILIPGGTFRVICPDILFYYDAYRNNNIQVFLEILNPHKLGVDYSRSSMQHFFVRLFAGALHSDSRYTDCYIDKIFNTIPFEEALDHFIKLLPTDSGGGYFHQNWFTENKMKMYMKNTGFEKIVATGPGKSMEPVFFTGQLYGFFDKKAGESFFMNVVNLWGFPWSELDK